MKRASVSARRGFGVGGWALAVLLALTVGSCGSGGQTKSQRASAPGSPPRGGARRASGPPFRVGSLTLEIEEPSAPAISNARSSSGTFIRRLPTVVRYPAAGRPNGRDNPGAAPARAEATFPLVVFSQGFDMPSEAYSWLLHAWASAGFVVAAPTYPYTNPTTPGGPKESDIVNHPADLRFVIGTLRNREVPAGGPLMQEIDHDEVAVVGHSDGGDVSLAVAAGSCCRDRALTAAVIMSGAEHQAFGGSYYSAGSVPLLAVQGSADTTNSPGCSIQLYDQAPRPKYYLQLVGAQHLAPYIDPGPDRTIVANVVVDFLRRYLQGRHSAARSLIREGNSPPLTRLSAAATAPAAKTSCPTTPPQ